MKDYMIPETGKWWFDETFPIDRDVVLIPEIIIEEYDLNSPQLLKPILDSVWNACGFERSLNYTKDGEWNPNN